jgi:hypothetical protein
LIRLGTGIPNDTEFNRRALIALRGVEFPEGSGAEAIANSCRSRIAAGYQLSPDQQQALFNIAHSWKKHYTDQLVKDYAAPRAKGAD